MSSLKATGSVPATGGLGLGQGTAMYVGALLGPGVMSLPALGAAVAGPASVLSWLILLVVSVPVAVCFAALAARYPDAGGISSFVARALGRRYAAVVGWWFYAAVPVGISAGALVGGHYVAAAWGLGQTSVYLIAAVLLVLAFAANYAGLRVSGALQLVLAATLVLLLVATVIVAAPYARVENFEPVAPHGWMAVGSAMVVLFYAFTGWEAASHLSAEFARPSRDLPRVTAATLLIVAVLYLALVLTTVGVLGAGTGSTPVPILHLLQRRLGDGAAPVTAVVAVLLSLGSLNTFVAGGARLGAALGRDRALPIWLARGGQAGHVPVRSLSVQAGLTASVLALCAVFSLDLEALMPLTSVLLAAVTTAGMVAATKLLTTPLMRALAVAGAVFSLIVLAFSSAFLLVPLTIAGICALTQTVLNPRSRE